MTYFQLRDYGVDGQIGLEATPAAFLDALYAVFDEVWRVLRDDGVVFCNLGDSYAGSGKGPSGSNGIGDQEKRQGFTGVSNKPTLNIGPNNMSRKSILGGGASVPGTRPKSLLLIPERFAIGMADRGWICRSQIVWAKKSAMPESVKDRPTSAWEPIFMFVKQGRYYWDADAVRQPLAESSAGRYAYAFGGAKSEHLKDTGAVRTRPVGEREEPASANIRNVWHLGPEPNRDVVTTTERVRVSVDDADGDTERTESPDCPVHASRPASISRRGGLQADPQSNTRHSGTGRALGPQDGRAPTPDLFSVEWEQPTSDAPSATPHSTPSSRTAPHAATTAADTACGETTLHTGGTSTQPDDGSLHLDTDGSSTASDDSGGVRGRGTLADTVGNVLSARQMASTGLHDAAHMSASSISAGSGSGALGPSVRTTARSTDKSTCTCSYHKVIITETSHFASYPTEIPRRCILAATSEKGQCPACGAPWRRVVERTAVLRPRPDGDSRERNRGGRDDGFTKMPNGVAGVQASTTGWEPGCACDAGEPVPQVVLDPFLGSGTTLLVASRLGRRGVGIELNPKYAGIARKRITNDAPLFADVEVEAS